jgi:hypothetical protein
MAAVVGFMVAVSMAAASAGAGFAAAVGAAAGVAAAVGADPDGAAAVGVIDALAGAGAVVGAAVVGIAVGDGAAAGVGATIRAGRSPRRQCLSESRSLRSLPMAAAPVAGSGAGFGRRTATIWGEDL